jgi:hypothetical protein
MHVGRDSVYKGQKVLQQGTAELQQAVDAGQVSVSAAADLADLPHEQQAVAVAAGPDAVVAKAKKVRERKKDRSDQPTKGATAPDRESDAATAETQTPAPEPAANVTAPDTISLTAKPGDLARALFERLGPKRATEVLRALEKLLKRSGATQPKGQRPASTSDGK